jgi:hypothetical protein
MRFFQRKRKYFLWEWRIATVNRNCFEDPDVDVIDAQWEAKLFNLEATPIGAVHPPQKVGLNVRAELLSDWERGFF